MKKQYFEDLGKYGVHVECESFENKKESSFHFIVGEFSIHFYGENKENDIVVTYPIRNYYAQGLSICLQNDDEFKRFIETLVEMNQHLEKKPYKTLQVSIMQKETGIHTLQDIIQYCVQRDAVYAGFMGDFLYVGHKEDSYEDNKPYVRFYSDFEGWIHGYQSEDGTKPNPDNEEDDIYVFPNAEVFEVKSELIKIGDTSIHLVYAILDEKECHIHFPIELYEGGKDPKEIHTLTDLKTEIDMLFEKAESERNKKGLSMYTYNWLQSFTEEIQKENSGWNDLRKLERNVSYSEEDGAEEKGVFVYRTVSSSKGVGITDDDLPF